MASRRQVIVAAAVVLGIVAAISSVVAVRQARHGSGTTVASAAAFTVSKSIPAGTSGDMLISEHLIEASTVPRSMLPSTAVVDVNTLRGKVTSSALAAGEIVLSGQFVDPQTASTSSGGITIPSGQVAITVSLDPSHAVGGLISPGDKVDLMTMFPLAGGAGAAGAGAAGAANASTYAHFFYQDALVLAVGTVTAPAGGSASSAPAAASSLYTLAVPPDQAERITLAAVNGSIWAALVPTADTPHPIAPVGIGSVDQTQGVPAAPSTTKSPTAGGASQ